MSRWFSKLLFCLLTVCFSGDAQTANPGGGINIPGTSSGGAGSAPVVGSYATISGTACNSSNPGQFGYVTDGPYFAYCDGSSAWKYRAFSYSVTPPPSASWTWDNQGSSSATVVGGALSLLFDKNASGFRAYYRTAPATPYTITFRGIRADFSEATLNGGVGGGVCFRDASGKIGALYYIVSIGGEVGVLVENWTTTTAFSAGVVDIADATVNYPLYRAAVGNQVQLRLADNGTNITYSISVDGFVWTAVATTSRTAFFASGPTQIGMCYRTTATQGGQTLLYDYTAQ